MGSVVLSRKEVEAGERRESVGALRSGFALAIIWLVNLLIILFGWPFLLYGKLKYRNQLPESRS